MQFSAALKVCNIFLLIPHIPYSWDTNQPHLGVELFHHIDMDDNGKCTLHGPLRMQKQQ